MMPNAAWHIAFLMSKNVNRFSRHRDGSACQPPGVHIQNLSILREGTAQDDIIYLVWLIPSGV
jgi:hypothetical protein